MMEAGRIWMVRTNAKDILGPFTTRELLKHVELQLVLPGDEATQSGEPWVYVQNISLDNDSYYFRDPEKTPAASISGYFVQANSFSNITQPPRTDSTESLRNHKETAEFPTVPLSHNVSSGPVKMNQPAIATLFGILALCLMIWFGANHSATRSLASIGNIGFFSKARDTKAVKQTRQWMKEVDQLIELGEYAKALDIVEKSAELAPDNKALWIPHAALLIKNGKSLDVAETLLRRAAGNDPKMQTGAHFWLGNLNFKKKNWEKARLDFVAVSLSDPKSIAAWVGIAKAELELNHPKEAVEVINKAERLDSNFYLPTLVKARALSQLGKISEAKEAYEMGIKLNPERWSSYSNYAEFLYTQGERAASREVLNRMLKTDPDYERFSPLTMDFDEPTISPGQYLALYNRVMEGRSDADGMVEREYLTHLADPETSAGLTLDAANGNLFTRVINLKVVLDQARSAAEIHQALSYLPHNLDSFGYFAYLLVGDAEAMLGMSKEAKGDLERALALNPNSASARLAYANLLKRGANDVAAIVELRRIVDSNPNYVPALKLTQRIKP